ncbi:MAG: ATP-dependent helicase, partial [Bdellovibrionales bacterium]|nr:ATP-dependent helicase [Bdellovibrionales bacterium]
GSGVLVLSHTNAAVDEISEKISTHCPRLFQYPNFVGTIQSFVDQFLAFPHYASKYKRRPIVDNDLYYRKANAFSERFLPGQQEQNRAKYYLNFNEGRAAKMRLSFDSQGKITLTDGVNGKELSFSRPGRGKPWTVDEERRVKEWCIHFKALLLNEGYLAYDDAYFLAECYIKEFADVIELLQKRFKLVFVDEMQDMEPHQYSILERIFYDSGRSRSLYQRLGDKNQAIYGGMTSHDSVWSQGRDNTLELKGSYRFSSKIAEVVKCFGLNYSEIEGRRLEKPEESNLKPTLLLFDDNSIEEVIPTFAKLISKRRYEGAIPQDDNPVYKAIGWVGKPRDEQNKLSIGNYHPTFEQSNSRSSRSRKSLRAAVQLHTEDTIPGIHKTLTRALLDILRLEGVIALSGVAYTQKSLDRYLRDSHHEHYPVFRANLYEWCLRILNEDHEEVIQSIRAYLPSFFHLFEVKLNESKAYISDDSPVSLDTDGETAGEPNAYIGAGVKIEINTVHGVKGQTHQATLFLETAYYNDGGKSYESQRLCEQFCGNKVPANFGKRAKDSAKISYVALSRPTHLLGFAVHRERFETYLKSSIGDNWDILEVPAGSPVDESTKSS